MVSVMLHTGKATELWELGGQILMHWMLCVSMGIFNSVHICNVC